MKHVLLDGPGEIAIEGQFVTIICASNGKPVRFSLRLSDAILLAYRIEAARAEAVDAPDNVVMLRNR